MEHGSKKKCRHYTRKKCKLNFKQTLSYYPKLLTIIIQSYCHMCIISTFSIIILLFNCFIFVVYDIDRGPCVGYALNGPNYLFGLDATYYPKSWGQLQNMF